MTFAYPMASVNYATTVQIYNAATGAGSAFFASVSTQSTTQVAIKLFTSTFVGADLRTNAIVNQFSIQILGS